MLKIIVLLCVSFVSGFLNAGVVERTSRLNCVLFEAEVRRAQLLWLPPRSERFLIGAIIRMKNLDRFFVVQDYLGEHPALETAVLLFQGEQGIDPEVEEYQYLGELHLVNHKDERAMGQILSANETSGYGQRLRNESPDTKRWMRPASVANLEKILLPLHPSLFSPQYRPIPYSKNEEHLLDSPGDVRHGFEIALNDLMKGLTEKGLNALSSDLELQATVGKVRWSLGFMEKQGHPALAAEATVFRNLVENQFQMTTQSQTELVQALQSFRKARQTLTDTISMLRLLD